MKPEDEKRLFELARTWAKYERATGDDLDAKPWKEALIAHVDSLIDAARAEGAKAENGRCIRLLADTLTGDDRSAAFSRATSILRRPKGQRAPSPPAQPEPVQRTPEERLSNIYSALADNAEAMSDEDLVADAVACGVDIAEEARETRRRMLEAVAKVRGWENNGVKQSRGERQASAVGADLAALTRRVEELETALRTAGFSPPAAPWTPKVGDVVVVTSTHDNSIGAISDLATQPYSLRPISVVSYGEGKPQGTYYVDDLRPAPTEYRDGAWFTTGTDEQRQASSTGVARIGFDVAHGWFFGVVCGVDENEFPVWNTQAASSYLDAREKAESAMGVGAKGGG